MKLEIDHTDTGYVLVRINCLTGERVVLCEFEDNLAGSDAAHLAMIEYQIAF